MTALPEQAVALVENVASAVTAKKAETSKIRRIVQTFSTFFGNHNVALINILLAALTLGGEELLEITVFKCPCRPDLAWDYTLVYTCGITFALWITGLIAYNQTWKVCHSGVCCKTCFQLSCPKCYSCCTKEPVKNSFNVGNVVKGFCGPVSRSYYGLTLSVFLKTAVVPAAWVFSLLVDGDYYACMYSSNGCDNTSEDYKELQRVSEMYAIIFLALFVVAGFLFRILYRCCISKSYRLHKFITVYKDMEEQELTKVMPESAKKLATNVVKGFLSQDNLKEKDWKAISETVTKQPEQGPCCYSPLHSLVVENHWLRKTDQTQNQPDTISKTKQTAVNVNASSGDN